MTSAEPAICPTLAGIGRVEDVCFSPDGRRLALAAFARHRIVLCDLEPAPGQDGAPRVVRMRELWADSLKLPHGVHFVDERTLVVANIGGTCALYVLPEGEGTELAEQTALPHAEPGCVRLAGRGTADAALLVCGSRNHALVRYPLQAGNSPGAPQTLLHRWLDLPDGVALSRDRQWLALSNHGAHSVLLYRYAQCGTEVDPVGLLRGVRYPHGLVFSADGRHLFVADAGAPFLRIYAADAEGDWTGVRHPVRSLRVIDERTFAAGHSVPQEGGCKGVDLHPDGRWLALAAVLQPLLLLDVQQLLAEGPAAAPPAHQDVPYELHVLAQQERRRLRTLADSWSWRITAPLRRIRRWFRLGAD